MAEWMDEFGFAVHGRAEENMSVQDETETAFQNKQLQQSLI